MAEEPQVTTAQLLAVIKAWIRLRVPNLTSCCWPAMRLSGGRRNQVARQVDEKARAAQ